VNLSVNLAPCYKANATDSDAVPVALRRYFNFGILVTAVRAAGSIGRDGATIIPHTIDQANTNQEN